MTKNIKLSYILLFIFTTIIVAFRTLSNFFGGVGLNFVALLGIVFALLVLSLSDKDVIKRIKDMFIAACAFCLMELIIYFACEFGNGETFVGFSVYQNIISFLGILLLVYVCFRFTTDFLGKRIKFIEIMLGNEKRAPKVKKVKEVTNGSLEDKPGNIKHVQTEDQEENIVIVETEE